MTEPFLSRRAMMKSLGFAASALALADVTWGDAAFAAFPEVRPEWAPMHPYVDHCLSLPVQVNGQMMHAMVDSGTTQSSIDHDLALDMDLRYLGTTTADTFTQQMSGALYKVDTFAVSGIPVRRVTLAAFELAELARRTYRDIPVVLGQDVLEDIDFQIDVPGSRIRGLPGKHDRSWPDHEVLSLYGFEKTFPSLRVVLEGKHHEDAILDTGSDAPMLISADYARDTGLLKGRKTSTAMTMGAEGAALGTIFTLETLRLGSFTLRGVPVQVIEDWRMEAPIYVGWTMLRAFDTVVSLGQKTLRLKPDAASLSAVFPKDRSGLAAQRRGNTIQIFHVARNSPAWFAGLRDNDVIVSINGVPVSPNYPAPGVRMGYGPAGQQIAVVTSDGRRFNIVLSDYF
ncbi:hypothetical protein WSK_1454 [Novosphingobium sp. Rr 2-17]|uniref:aspartyl protease family protein n=1 Tax=Novosphingobium sp. Rr 2-17 TaxID=555793 RepID=UPI0002698EAE|nr:aspartyl protease family protein [Novosphingobium sp. Rr 2-17]EIZ80087.1 hypothetical protein WSK_1454 [Novosphingobium sp. Rr 2-17]